MFSFFVWGKCFILFNTVSLRFGNLSTTKMAVPGPVPFSSTKLRVPRGFQNILEGLAREILRSQPEEIFKFGASYFAGLLEVREGKWFRCLNVNLKIILVTREIWRYWVWPIVCFVRPSVCKVPVNITTENSSKTWLEIGKHDDGQWFRLVYSVRLLLDLKPRLDCNFKSESSGRVHFWRGKQY